VTRVFDGNDQDKNSLPISDDETEKTLRKACLCLLGAGKICFSVDLGSNYVVVVQGSDNRKSVRVT
jgi:hypothetical protein